ATQFPSYGGEGPMIGDFGLDMQLHEVARIIKAQSQVGDARQMFYVQIQGFDTHNTELVNHAALLRFVSSYLNNFWSALGEIGMQSNVTLFTTSDFGRTLGSNG